MRKVLSVILVLSVALGLTIPFATPVAASIVTFTGHVTTDFAAADVWIIPDPQGDVGIPTDTVVPTPPVGTTSGWDMQGLRLTYDPGSDTMYVGINTWGIAGDADGDGFPGGTSAWMAARGGTDLTNLDGTECFAVYFDMQNDGVYEVIAGVSRDTDTAGFGVYEFDGSEFDPGAAFGNPLPTHTGTFSGIMFPGSPNATYPDLEFTITNWSTLPGNGGIFNFRVDAFMGSLEDDGVGEDFIHAMMTPSISIVKTVDCNDDGVYHQSETVVGTSDEADWKVVVTNTGDETVLNIVVTDTNGHDFGAPFSLAVGAHQEFNYTTTITETTTNTATAEGVNQIGAQVGPVSSTATNNLTQAPHTTIQSITASPLELPPGGADVTITVTDLNDGDVPITGAYFVLTSSTGGGPVHMLPDGVAIAPGATQVFTYTFLNVTENTTFTAVGHGFAGTFDVTGPSETGTVRVIIPPPVPASSVLSTGLLIAGLAGAVTFFGWQRRKRSQPLS